ncbi:regulatory protein [Treponema rectale]|uniref:Regulatory protein RecX n=1 Tax=Treponema rectale TaxID=744512 RepID=A0A840SIV2_9SPIR|nr:regulatory protein [Treponema rectale]
MHAEDSSSASAKSSNLRMVIRGIKQILLGVYEITPDAGSAFFLRADYLSQVNEERLLPYGYGRLDVDLDDLSNLKEGDTGFFTEEETADLFNASRLYSVEKSAMSYLNRSEHTRNSLCTKLLRKGYDKRDVEEVLDYLEEKNILSDLRFAAAWVRSRSLDHAEGRTRLTAELTARGVNRSIIKQVLDEYFLENDEEELCVKAFKKLVKIKKDEDKIKASLVRQGFSFKIIKKILHDANV